MDSGGGAAGASGGFDKGQWEKETKGDPLVLGFKQLGGWLCHLLRWRKQVSAMRKVFEAQKWSSLNTLLESNSVYLENWYLAYYRINVSF